MNGIDALRKNYTVLSPRERASMFFTETTGHQREEVVLALKPATAVDAIKTSMIESVMLVIAGNALTASLREERGAFAALALREGSIDEVFPSAYPGWRRSLAWAMALQQLEAETGMAFLAAATLLSDKETLGAKLVQGGMLAETDTSIDFSEQLEVLRELWETGTKSIS